MHAETKGVRIRSESESDRIRTVIHSDRISFFYCRIGSDFVGFCRIGSDLGFFLYCVELLEYFNKLR
jgi:hypothetical protein